MNSKKSIKFEKVSFKEFLESCRAPECWYLNSVPDEKIQTWYNEIKLPERSSKGSAGYDFYYPFDFLLSLGAGTTFSFPTGIRAVMPEDVFLMIVPRSGFGFKTGTRLVNSVGIIDSSYSTTPHEGHIKCKLEIGQLEDSITIQQHDRLIQGIFTKCFFTDDDHVTAERTGGFGSSGK